MSNAERAFFPSPIEGEGGREPTGPAKGRPDDKLRERPGEGCCLLLNVTYADPSPASLTLRVRSAPSPSRGEGRKVAR